jgi:hypothetical protein
MNAATFIYLPIRQAYLNLAHVAFFDAQAVWPEVTLTVTDCTEEGHAAPLVIGLDKSDAAVLTDAINALVFNPKAGQP